MSLLTKEERIRIDILMMIGFALMASGGTGIIVMTLFAPVIFEADQNHPEFGFKNWYSNIEIIMYMQLCGSGALLIGPQLYLHFRKRKKELDR